MCQLHVEAVACKRPSLCVGAVYPYAYTMMGTALFPTKRYLWYFTPSPPFGLVERKALKNLSDYPLV